MSTKDKEQKRIYYSDELNDEFSATKINCRKIDETYSYDGHPFFRKLSHIFWYRMIFYPGAWLYLKLVWHQKFVNRKVIRQAKGRCIFLYGNHTNDMADPYIPTFTVTPRTNFVIVHAANVSIPLLGKITPALGAIPLPDNLAATKNFMASIKNKVDRKKVVTIYPEAHIWPYYTKIRPFTDLSFRYPVQYDTPVFCFTNTYQKRKFGSRPKIVTYVDGPFYADKNLPAKDQRKALRDSVYETMCRRSLNSNVEVIKYIKKDNTQEPMV